MGAQSPEGHLESDYLAQASSESEARDLLGATPLSAVKLLLGGLIAVQPRGSQRPGWDAMRDDGET